MNNNIFMKPHPLELRRRIVNAVENQIATIAEIAEMFDVSQRYIYKLLQLNRETGDVIPRPHSGGAEAKLLENHLMKLTHLVAQFPDATLEELREMLRKSSRVDVSVATIWRALDKQGLTLKKSPNVHLRLTPGSEQLSRKSRLVWQLMN